MTGRNVAIYVSVTPLDMRRSFDGLAADDGAHARKTERAQAPIADAVLDRLVHNAHKLTMKGPSRRKEKAPTS